MGLEVLSYALLYFQLICSTLGDDFFAHLIGFVSICHETNLIRTAEAAALKET